MGGAQLRERRSAGPNRDKSYSRALDAGDRVIVPSHYVADQVVTRHQVPREKLAVIPRRIDGARFDPPAISPERAMVLRRGWKIARGQRMVLVPGRIDPAKGQLILVEAARILTNGGLRGVVFVLAGDNRSALRLRQENRRAGRGARRRASDPPGRHLPRHGGRVSGDRLRRGAADRAAGVSARRRRSDGDGRPVIATNVGAVPEIVQAPPHVREAARTGWLAEPDDAVSFARAIATALATEASTYNAIGMRARRLANQYFMPARTSASALEPLHQPVRRPRLRHLAAKSSCVPRNARPTSAIALARDPDYQIGDGRSFTAPADSG